MERCSTGSLPLYRYQTNMSNDSRVWLSMPFFIFFYMIIADCLVLQLLVLLRALGAQPLIKPSQTVIVLQERPEALHRSKT